MRKILQDALTLIVCFVLLCFAPAAWADNQNADSVEDGAIIGSGEWGDLDWVLDSNGSLTISGSGSMQDFQSIYYASADGNGYRKVIQDAWLQYRDSINTVNIESGVVNIGAYAFYECNHLQTISIPSSIKMIGGSAFYNCSELKSVAIPPSVTSIGYSAFYGCVGLNRVTIPESVYSIDHYAFCGCSRLTKISIPASVTKIADSTFKGCSSLKNVTIQSGVSSIGKSAFYGCSEITYIKIPSSVRYIDDYAFYGCSGLTSVAVPATVTERLGSNTFSECTSLTTVTSPSWGDYVNCPAVSVTVPYGTTAIINSAFADCGRLTDVIIPDSVTSIGNLAFSNCCELKKITIPSDVTSIGNHAFYNCSKLKDITIPEFITIINPGVFSYCSGLTHISIPGNVTSIGSGAFSDCSSLKRVVIPQSLMKIDYSAFDYCDTLSDVYYAGTLEQWKQITINSDNEPINKAMIHFSSDFFIVTFNANGGIEEPSAQLKAPGEALRLSWESPNREGYYFLGWAENADAETASYLPGENYTQDADVTLYALWGNPDFVLPESLTEIGEEAFAGAAARFVKLPDSTASVGPRAFAGCTELCYIVIPDYLNQIDFSAFEGTEDVIVLTFSQFGRLYRLPDYMRMMAP